MDLVVFEKLVGFFFVKDFGLDLVILVWKVLKDDGGNLIIGYKI